MKKYFVYMLRCADDSYYIGITNNLQRRMEEHSSGMDSSCYTYQKRPLKLVYAGHFSDVLHAIKWEKQIKGWSRKKKEMLINGDWERLPELSFSQYRKTINSISLIIHEQLLVMLSSSKH